MEERQQYSLAQRQLITIAEAFLVSQESLDSR